MLSLMDIAAVLLTLSAVFGWFNHKFLPLSHSVGLLVMSVATSWALIGLDAILPGVNLLDQLSQALRQIDFAEVVVNGMLAFLLFAGSLQVDLDTLKSRAFPVFLLAVFGTLISTAIVGLAFWGVCRLGALPVSLPWAFVFGALISPTDPVAVLNVLRNASVPKELQIETEGEALFNDGVGIVLFTLLLRFASAGEGVQVSATDVAELLVREAGGGLLLGLVTGYIAYRAMRLIDDYPIEVLISVALVTGTYALAHHLHVSGPLSMVAAGLLIGDRGPRYAMSEQTQSYLFGLWTLVDEILNSVLFLLIGLETLVLQFEVRPMLTALTAVPIVLLARFASVALQPILFAWTRLLSLRNTPFLTWAGVRGGISVALALSLPNNPAKSSLLAATYAVVLFSVIVQGSTLGLVARRTIGRANQPSQ
ncbi:MAG: sodium:proton antiporter [Bradyrhizobium sp.]|uniref:cation:proton antiporter n=1 Tax=Bradyrhizobium sp. TaxID=376 RepID=UPI001C2A20EB|nr:sodium:proton antiporter [Bradyrhizobium sp.]MBU6463593.1 sodium:proton antiporter [Pseudomonadota bacterium]MDE2067021.1 sodium:proton antiporter [Bradyrhizobium sp.]MDE2241249.1 sodium:proton antiporter [Bradyrhizobium sp.]MDE2472390.1 sodium:proton antiporter [Bradyrhizobium sp.]